MASKFTHSICEDCWIKKHPDPAHIPVRMLHREIKICCYCGNPTASGIFVREDPDALLCKGDHTEHE